MKERDATTLATLRLLKAAAQNAQVAKGEPLTDDEYERVITQQAKLRRDAIAEYDRAGRPDRSEQERAEMTVLQRYLPEQLTEEAIRGIVSEAIAQVGAKGPADMGKVMQAVMPSVRGRADGSTVSALVRQLLATNGQ